MGFALPPALLPHVETGHGIPSEQPFMNSFSALLGLVQPVTGKYDTPLETGAEARARKFHFA